jgi:hypothetical protein
MDEWKGKFGTPDGLIPLVGRKRHSPGAGTFNHATATSGVKVAQHPQGLTLTPAQGGGARWRWATRLISYVVVIDTHVRFRGEAPRDPRVLGKHVCPFRAGCWLGPQQSSAREGRGSFWADLLGSNFLLRTGCRENILARAKYWNLLS